MLNRHLKIVSLWKK